MNITDVLCQCIWDHILPVQLAAPLLHITLAIVGKKSLE